MAAYIAFGIDQTPAKRGNHDRSWNNPDIENARARNGRSKDRKGVW